MLPISSTSDASTKALRRKLYKQMAQWRHRLLLLIAQFWFILAMDCGSCSISLRLFFPKTEMGSIHSMSLRDLATHTNGSLARDWAATYEQSTGKHIEVAL
jgi:hypothetical protein